jgi:exosortase
MPVDSSVQGPEHDSAIVWCAGAGLLAFAPVIAGLPALWFHDGDMSHGLLAPIVAGWIVWQQRDRLRSIESKPSMWGLLWMGLATAATVVGFPCGWYSVARISLLLWLAGAILFLRGWGTLCFLAFPLLLLSFAIPPPTFLYEQITFPLQLLASRSAEIALEFLGLSVLRDGNILELAGQRLSVAEACSGIRSLFSLCFFGLVYAHVFDRRWWMPWVLAAASVPVAIVANALRIVLTGLIGEYNPVLAQGTWHELSGWAVFVAAMVLMVGLQRSLRLPRRTYVTALQ